MYSSSLSTHRCIHALHCSKQCYTSPTPRTFSSWAIFAFTSSTDGKWVPFSTLFTLGYIKGTGCQICQDGGCSNIRMRLSGRNFLTERVLWAGALSWCSIQTLFFQRFGRFLLKICRTLSLSLSVNTHHVCNHSHTQPSIFANNYTDFLNVLVSFRSQRLTWTLIIFHFLPTLTKSFEPLERDII